ncbi:MAG: HaeIII family restriction endonuclease [Coriobacteriia bacterium]|nr:HaeIII family restriction endonuclease [Coriobacteriia bacterium]
MSNLSNRNGRAYEYAYLLLLEENLAPFRNVVVEKNSSYFASKSAWDALSNKEHETYKVSASAGITALTDLEPLILEDDSSPLEIKLQSDDAGKQGDVRDIVIVRKNIHWEIGLSLKHNHFAVKHSRLSKDLDFGEKWFGIKCSGKYWSEVAPVFEYLSKMKDKNATWSELPAKEHDVYVPLLNAFLNEIKRSHDASDGKIARKMVEYLLGKFDFYKIIGLDNKRTTQVQPYNLQGTLNKSSKKQEPLLVIPVSELPTKIVGTEFKPSSSNTVMVYMDNGWQLSFRIHNASTKVETSLKFDVQIIGMPTTIVCIDCKWE